MRPALLLLLALPMIAPAQVQIENGLRFTDQAGGQIIDLAPPVMGTSAIPVSVSASGIVHWADATLNATTILLTLTPDVPVLNNGLVIRFLSPLDNAASVTISTHGSTPTPLQRTDGTVLPPHALRLNGVAEIMYMGGAWWLLNPSTSSCPPGSIRTAGNVCIEQNSVPGMRFYQAVEHCAARGGKLCSWDEYAVGCALHQSTLAGLFNEWEWIDGSSNHTHSVNQAGRTTCQSQRSANAVTLIVGDTRCCYRTR